MFTFGAPRAGSVPFRLGVFRLGSPSAVSIPFWKLKTKQTRLELLPLARGWLRGRLLNTARSESVLASVAACRLPSRRTMAIRRRP